jgi:hypothetical protein
MLIADSAAVPPSTLTEFILSAPKVRDDRKFIMSFEGFPKNLL